MRSRPRIMLAAIVLASVITWTAASQAAAGSGLISAATSSVTPGAWTRLGIVQGGTVPALVHLPNGNDLVVWQPIVTSNKRSYDAVEIRPKGRLASSPYNVFGSQYWGGLGDFPSLLLDKGKALLIFDGAKGDSNPKDPYNDGCLVGDLLTAGSWKLQPWSLSSDCVQTDHFGATITANETLSAAWAFGGIMYRIGVAPSIPAPPPDQLISTPLADDSSAAETTETHSQNIYAGWDRFFSKTASKDGIWVANLSKKSTPVKAPNTGTNLVAHQPEPVAMASPTGRGGIYVAYCNNANPCTKVELWRYGAKNAVTVPQSSNPTSVALSSGPAGRLWVAWWSAHNGTVRVVRTNEAGSAFGPVETYAGPDGCQSDGNGSVKISSGSQQRADVVVSCYGRISGTNYQPEAMTTQSLAPLQIAATTGLIKHKKGGSVTYRVSDVGDAVPGAMVTVDGKQGTTDKKGQVTFHFAKGAKTGTFRVVASIADYLNASTALHIT